MKKIVINKCYGGFSLSIAGIKAFAKAKGLKVYFYANKENWDDGYVRVDHPNEKELFPPTPFYKDFGPEPEKGKVDFDFVLSAREIKRDDPALIAVVKKLGSKANCRYSKLEIVEIPDDVEYTIEEYDGIEWVAEKHRTWG